MSDFAVGDRVSWRGRLGTVQTVSSFGNPIVVWDWPPHGHDYRKFMGSETEELVRLPKDQP